MRIVIMGAPGSGKGTQCSILRESYGVPHISTGELLRAEVEQKSDLGLKADSYLQAGTLVPDGLILQMVEDRLEAPDAQRGWLMDGFPRTVRQAHGLLEITERIGQLVTTAVILGVDADVVIERLSGRARNDDSPELVRKRLRVYEEETRPLFDFMREHFEVHDIDASKTVANVSEELKSALERYRQS